MAALQVHQVRSALALSCRAGPSRPGCRPGLPVRALRPVSQTGTGRGHHLEKQRASVGASAGASAGVHGVDPELEEAINEACRKCLQVMRAQDDAAAALLSAELQETQYYLDAEKEEQAVRFLGVLRSLLAHSVPREADALVGRYRQAVDSLFGQLQVLDWSLAEGQGRAGGPRAEEPSFSTWEDVLGKKGRQQQQQQAGPGSAAPAGPADTSYYALLGVLPSASDAEIKAAYRRLALKLHPDVNDAPDATERFAALANAYDTLSDATSRRLYDQFGPEGMKRQPGAEAGQGNASRAWEEFKPYKRENKHTRARDAARASYGSSFDASFDQADEADAARSSANGSAGSSSSGAGAAGAALPVTGDVVEYPLGDVVKQQLLDGRTHGVALIVGRNMDRGDAKKLPPEALDLCELEPLRQEEAGSDRWIPDELSPPAFCRLGELRRVAVDWYDPRYDVWRIAAPLSEGCGGPELGDEIIL